MDNLMDRHGPVNEIFVVPEPNVIETRHSGPFGCEWTRVNRVRIGKWFTEEKGARNIFPDELRARQGSFRGS